MLFPTSTQFKSIWSRKRSGLGLPSTFPRKTQTGIRVEHQLAINIKTARKQQTKNSHGLDLWKTVSEQDPASINRVDTCYYDNTSVSDKFSTLKNLQSSHENKYCILSHMFPIFQITVTARINAGVHTILFPQLQENFSNNRNIGLFMYSTKNIEF